MSSEKYFQRIHDLFKDIESLEASPAARIQDFRCQLDALRARLRELEQELLVHEDQALLPNPASDERSSAPIIFEKDQVGFAYEGEQLRSIKGEQLPEANQGDLVDIPLVAAGKSIGGIRLKPSAERPLTADEMNLAGEVVRRASQQIQNLQLLWITEQARAQAEASTRRFVHEGWATYLDAIHQDERIGYLYDQASVAPFREKLRSDTGHTEPIRVTDEQVGTLYLKPDPASPLSDSDKQFVSAVAGRLAQQVENLRLLADASRARAEAEDATRQLTRQSWQKYLDSQNTPNVGFQYDAIQISRFDAASLPSDVVMTQPLIVRGETVGQLAVAGLGDVTPEALQLAASIAAQASIHLETLRLSEQNEKRAYEMEAVAELSTATSTVLDPDRLLQTIVDLTQKRFGIYHAQIYLADDSWQTLLLAAGSGEAGRQLVAEQHTIPFSAQQSLVARAVSARTAQIVNDVRSDPAFLPHPLLPDTRAEMAVPMIVGDRVLGVFDLVADRIGGFGEQDAGIYTTLAMQVAVAIQNARLYAEQAATVTQLRELDRLKSSFLANMSHELRTPLNSILGFSDVILAEIDGPLTENMNSDLQLIQKNGRHLLHLINDVLDMAKIEAGRMNLSPELFAVRDVLDEVVGITSSLAAEKKLDLHVTADSDASLSVTADRTRLQQVMINLVNNAIKFTDAGSVSIQAQRVDGTALISVKDTGSGIPPGQLETIFQEFAQIDTSSTRKVGGTGLGLPISRRLVEMHGGRLWAESKGIAGEGSVFFVELPLEARIAEPIERTEK